MGYTKILRYKTKTPVFGMMERKEIGNSKGKSVYMSYVHAMVVEKTDKATLVPIIQQFIADGSAVFTDELNAICNHGAMEYVSEGNVYTNNIEVISEE